MLKRSISNTAVFTAGDLTQIREVLHPKNEEGLSASYSLAFATLEPGEASLPHILQERSEVYVIVNGHGRAWINDEQSELEPGDVLYIPAGARQHVENIGTGQLGFWCIVSPPWSADDESIQE